MAFLAVLIFFCVVWLVEHLSGGEECVFRWRVVERSWLVQSNFIAATIMLISEILPHLIIT